MENVSDKQFKIVNKPHKHFKMENTPDKHFEIVNASHKHFKIENMPDKHFKIVNAPHKHFEMENVSDKHFKIVNVSHLLVVVATWSLAPVALWLLQFTSISPIIHLRTHSTPAIYILLLVMFSRARK